MDSTPVLAPPNQVNLSHSRQLLKPVDISEANVSPRRRFLQQKKKQSNRLSFGAKLNKKLSFKSQKTELKLVPVKPVTPVLPNKAIPVPVRQDLDNRQVLFKCHKAKITCFASNQGSSEDFLDFDVSNLNSKDGVIGQGELEIYSILQDKQMNYLKCGSKLIYPIFPKMKILRISEIQFIMALSNPERYWLISLDQTELDISTKLNELVNCLKNICSFRNLYIPVSRPVDTEKLHKRDEESVKSVTSELACFDLSKSETDDIVSKNTTNITEETTSRHRANNSGENLSKTLSNQSSLDLELDEFEKTLIHSPRLVETSSNVSDSMFKTVESLHRKPSFETMLSRSSLYQQEPSWMNLDESDSIFSQRLDPRTLTNSIMYQNLNKFQKTTLSKLSQEDIKTLVHTDLDQQSRSMMGRLFGW